MGEIDLALRHVTRQFPEELARALLGKEAKFIVKEWLETQVTSRERRLDRALEVLYEGAPHILHFEFQVQMEPDVPFRVYEYNSLLACALPSLAKPGEAIPTIESCVVLLSGKKEGFPNEGFYQTSRRGRPFCGVQYRLEAVYQESLEELLARDNLLWLIFAPLTCDIRADNLEGVLKEMEDRAPNQRAFEELAVAMTVLASVAPEDKGLSQALRSLLPREIIMQSWIYTEGFEKGKAEGEAKGKAEGKAEGEVKGKAEGKAEAILRVLGARKIRVSEKQKQTILSCHDLSTLERYLTLAITASSTAELLAQKEPAPSLKATPVKKAPSRKK